MPTLDKIRDEEVLALDQLIDLYGPRGWKNELRSAWENGRYSSAIDDAPALQRLRNRLGPSVLSSLGTTDVRNEAVAIAINRRTLSTTAKAAARTMPQPAAADLFGGVPT